MNEKLDLITILEGCPIGTRLWHVIYGDVYLLRVDPNSEYPITVSLEEGRDNLITLLTNNGKMDINDNGECLLYPSRCQRNWDEFKQIKHKFNVNNFQPFDKVLTRSRNGGQWEINLFSYMHNHKPGEDTMVRCLHAAWEQVIPFNEETKHLLHTTDDCLEYYKWWENLEY